jgi:rhodanese-related sulfurtransferase
MDGEVSSDAVRERLADDDRDDPRIIDVRTPMEFNNGHIPDSENIPLGEIPNRIDEFVGDGDEDIVTVCASGNRSLQAVHYLASNGVDVEAKSMAGGVKGWNGDLVTGSSDAVADSGAGRFF